ncbi:MAG: CCA tRNA nucleotidyltransferase [Candidatus Pacebacteria bacterium]|nr:CCA tRNA nucleotidyltransferase [Candidatus Paceibacterota bacterium]MBP9772213.1 CCA tRNA nucleotidyltransferase [Candidatus Paceibacterota bacterium]
MSPEKTIKNESIPSEILEVMNTLEKAGFEAFLVGGCVRDLLLNRKPKDWDITTNAAPEEIIPLYEKTVYENNFGTVAIILENTEDKTLKQIEITPYRTEGKYSDKRHPDTVSFSKNINDDLSRRDFTVNALAYNPSKSQLIDLFEGIKDIKVKTIRTVGNSSDRFSEDALRMIRAIRFSCELGFAIESDTLQAIVETAQSISEISAERTRDEFVKIIMSPEPIVGIAMLQKTGMLKYIIPELEQGIGCEQGGAHKFDVYEHLLQALQHSADKGWPLEIRLSALFHDIGKPKTRRKGIKKAYTFYGHEVVGARMARVIMERMKFPKDTTELVTSLVRYHMFFSDTEQITLSAVRRVVRNVGVENIWTLMNVRECDRVGMAKVEAPYRLRKYHAMIEQVLRDPISVSQLVVDGNVLMKELDVKAGPRMGWILNSLLEEVLDDPEKNTREYLDKRVGELNQLEDKSLKLLGEKAKQIKDEAEEKELGEIHRKHNVKK